MSSWKPFFNRNLLDIASKNQAPKLIVSSKSIGKNNTFLLLSYFIIRLLLHQDIRGTEPGTGTGTGWSGSCTNRRKPEGLKTVTAENRPGPHANPGLGSWSGVLVQAPGRGSRSGLLVWGPGAGTWPLGRSGRMHLFLSYTHFFLLQVLRRAPA